MSAKDSLFSRIDSESHRPHHRTCKAALINNSKVPVGASPATESTAKTGNLIESPNPNHTANWRHLVIEKQPRISFAEFVAWEQDQTQWHELIGGRVVPFRAGSADHESITVNVISKLKAAVEPPCKVFGSSAIFQTATRIGQDAYRPDVTVSCSPANIGSRLYMEEPRIVVEVISPSNSGREWNEKLFEYANTLSIEQLILIESLERYVTSHVRDANGIWQRPVILINEGTLEFSPIGVTITLAKIYEDTSLA
jgi:Uma2 family endonuclease